MSSIGSQTSTLDNAEVLHLLFIKSNFLDDFLFSSDPILGF